MFYIYIYIYNIDKKFNDSSIFVPIEITVIEFDINSSFIKNLNNLKLRLRIKERERKRKRRKILHRAVFPRGSLIIWCSTLKDCWTCSNLMEIQIQDRRFQFAWGHKRIKTEPIERINHECSISVNNGRAWASGTTYYSEPSQLNSSWNDCLHSLCNFVPANV